MEKYVFAELDKAVDRILNSGKKLIYIAGASASGKTFIAEEIVKKLQEKGKKTMSISSDSYYVSDTGIRSVLYGTFDHPELIDYPLLAKNIDEYKLAGKFSLPEYSFAESRRIGYVLQQADSDFIIVEGLYTISQLPHTGDSLRIFIDANEEDLIIRRLLRDPARVGEPLYMVIGALNNVFPMRHLYGTSQSDIADLHIINEYDLLAKDGTHMYREPYTAATSKEGTEYNKEHIVEYAYNDTSADTNGKILITEHYDHAGGYLRSVGISKTHSTPQGTDKTLKHISLRIYKSGVLTQIHNLMQSAGLKFEGYTKFDQITYIDNAKKQYVIEDRQQGKYIRYEM